MLTTQHSLIERVGQGDSAAWSRFVSTYDDLVRSFLRKRAAAHGYYHVDNFINDVVQNVWIKLLSSRQGLCHDPERGRFRTFLYTVTINALNDFFRRERRHLNGRSEMPLADELGSNSESDQAEWYKAYKRAIFANVCGEQREKLLAGDNPNMWHAFEQFTLQHRPAAEVAQKLGIRVDLVYQNASRCLKQIKASALELYEEDPTL